MKREIYKTIILTALVLSSILLFSQTWYGEKLWPEGYNFFISGKSTSVFNRLMDLVNTKAPKNENPTNAIEAIITPRKIVVSEKGKRTVYLNKTQPFNNVYTNVLEIIKSLPKLNLSTKPQVVDNNEWFNALKTKSIYFDYSIAINSTVWANATGAIEGLSANGVNNIKDIIISPGDTILNNIIIYFKDYESGNIIKLQTQLDNSKLDLLIENEIKQTNAGNKPFSFELSFNRSGEGAIEQKVVIDSNVLIGLNSENSHDIKAANTIRIDKSGEIEQRILSDILKMFGFKENSLRKYIETNNTFIFVENFGTLKLYPQGFIEYQSVDNTKGIKLTSEKAEGEDKNLYDITARACYFVNKLLEATSVSGADLGVVSNIMTNKQQSYTLYFDFFINGLPVSFYDANNPTAQGHAIEMEIVNDSIVKYRQYTKSFEQMRESTTNIPLIKALDGIYKQFNSQETKIQDVFLSYIDQGDGVFKTAWCARVAGSNKTIVLSR